MWRRLVKRIEWLGKVLLASLVALAVWRPGRRRQVPGGPSRVLLVRIDDRVGEALLTTPLIHALARAGHEVHLLAHPNVVRVLRGHPDLARVWALERTWAAARAAWKAGFDVVVNCGNWDAAAVTSAVVARVWGHRAVVVGPARFPSSWLCDVPVEARPGTRGEVVQRTHLGSPLLGPVEPGPLSFPPVAPARRAGRYAVVNPGGRLAERRVEPEVFRAAARALCARGLEVVVTWGPGEEALASRVAEAIPGVAVAPPTDLAALAALMHGAEVTVCNNTGPMHLAVAVGCVTVALFQGIEVERWGHGPPHLMVDVTGQGVDGASAAVRRAVESVLDGSRPGVVPAPEGAVASG